MHIYHSHHERSTCNAQGPGAGSTARLKRTSKELVEMRGHGAELEPHECAVRALRITGRGSVHGSFTNLNLALARPCPRASLTSGCSGGAEKRECGADRCCSGVPRER